MLTAIFICSIILCLIGVAQLGIKVYGLISSRNPNRFVSIDEYAGYLSVLNAIIQTEFDAYDQDIFSHKGSITNSNFDNYYKQLCNTIINNLNPGFIDQLGQIYTKDAIYGLIARRVKVFLTGKINTVI